MLRRNHRSIYLSHDESQCVGGKGQGSSSGKNKRVLPRELSSRFHAFLKLAKIDRRSTRDLGHFLASM